MSYRDFNHAAYVALIRLNSGNNMNGAMVAARAMARLSTRETQGWAARHMIRQINHGFSGIEFAQINVAKEDVGIHLELMAWNYEASEHASWMSDYEAEQRSQNYSPYSPEDPRELALIADFEAQLAAAPSFPVEQEPEPEMVEEPQPEPFSSVPDYLKAYAERLEREAQQQAVADKEADANAHLNRWYDEPTDDDDGIPF